MPVNEELILFRLDAIERDMKSANKLLGDIRTDIALLKFKSGLWGASGAGLTIILIGIARHYIL